MKTLFILITSTITLFSMTSHVYAFEKEAQLVLFDMTCFYALAPDQDPKLTLTFSEAKTPGFVKVTASERVYPKFRKDETYVTVYEEEIRVRSEKNVLTLQSEDQYFLLKMNLTSSRGKLLLAGEKVLVDCAN